MTTHFLLSTYSGYFFFDADFFDFFDLLDLPPLLLAIVNILGRCKNKKNK